MSIRLDTIQTDRETECRNNITLCMQSMLTHDKETMKISPDTHILLHKTKV